MNTHAVDALLDYADDEDGYLVWRDRGVQHGSERWRIVYRARDGSVTIAKGGTLDDAARSLCDTLRVSTGDLRIDAAS